MRAGPPVWSEPPREALALAYCIAVVVLACAVVLGGRL